MCIRDRIRAAVKVRGRYLKGKISASDFLREIDSFGELETYKVCLLYTSHHTAILVIEQLCIDEIIVDALRLTVDAADERHALPCGFLFLHDVEPVSYTHLA